MNVLAKELSLVILYLGATFKANAYTHKPLYEHYIHYDAVLDTWFKDGSQNCLW